MLAIPTRNGLNRKNKNNSIHLTVYFPSFSVNNIGTTSGVKK